LIGLFLNWFPFFKWDGDHLIFKDWHDVRILGVLQRIAICYLLAAALIFIFDVKKLISIQSELIELNGMIGLQHIKQSRHSHRNSVAEWIINIV
jgi:predicted acyltransferase